MAEAILNRRLQQILQRVLSFFTDEMTTFDSNLRDDLRGVQGSIALALNVLVKVEGRRMEGQTLRLWLMELEEIAYDADDVVDELSYEILCRKVNDSSIRRIYSLRKFAFSFQLSNKVKNLNQRIQNFKIENERISSDSIGAPRIDDKVLLRFRIDDKVLLGFEPCIVFCLTFPSDFVIKETELIQLWMAEGLVDSYDDANICLSGLSWHKIIQVVDEPHDCYAYNLNCKIRGPEHHHSRADVASSVRYLYTTNSKAVLENGDKKLRTLILDGVPFQDSWKLDSLRTIVFWNSIDMEELPTSIGRLKHLRYLDVSNTRLGALPEFVTKLYNLQTLRFLNCKNLKKIPRKFNNLTNMKNIAFSFQHQMPFGLGKLKHLETLSFFVVGSDRGGSIGELEFLNELRQLEITRLEEVRDWKEAERANLLRKTKLDVLCFQWSFGEHDRSSSDEILLEGLQPHPKIKTIKIKYYMGKLWPSWMSRPRSPNKDDSFMINNLVDLTLERCWNCTQLPPPLGDLPFLKYLTLKHMQRVKCIYNGIGREGNNLPWLFPALESLSLSWMENLIEWSYDESLLNGKKVAVFPRLKTLYIQSCPGLAFFPMAELSELENIEIKNCDELRLRQQQSFPSIANISIEGCPKLDEVRNWLVSKRSFNNFRVRRCEWLEFIPGDLGEKTSLISLGVNCCKRLAFFSEDILCKLVRLRKLSIGAFSEKLDDFCYLNRIQYLQWLKELEIWGSDFLGREMSYLPDQLQHLVSLESLKIMGFTTMEALPEWFSNLQSLGTLSLNYCWHLEYQSTTSIIQRLSKLKHLYIIGCHALENKSQWNEFSRITKIEIHFSALAE